jgi:hypothetical protein
LSLRGGGRGHRRACLLCSGPSYRCTLSGAGCCSRFRVPHRPACGIPRLGGTVEIARLQTMPHGVVWHDAMTDCPMYRVQSRAGGGGAANSVQTFSQYPRPRALPKRQTMSALPKAVIQVAIRRGLSSAWPRGLQYLPRDARAGRRQ